MKSQKPKLIMADIDGTICQNRDDLREEELDSAIHYKDVKPYLERIKMINELYDEGHNITYWTARGCHSKEDYTELTRDQLVSWGAKFHDLIVGSKPHFDMYICDKSYNCESYFHHKKRGLP